MSNPSVEKMPFGDRLATAISERGSLCVGIDPHAQLLEQWGLPDNAEGLRAFTEAVVEGCGDHVAAFKPQVAFFERHGAAGFQVLEELFTEARVRNILIIADAKRGDIGSTMKAYADSWLGSSPLATDSVTLSPYLGFESLRPALDAADKHQRGTFVLALTSNPEGRSVQHVGGTASVARSIIEQAHAENERSSWYHMGSCGLVVGATVGQALVDLEIDLSSFNGPILAPGYGAQGATAADLYSVFSGIEKQVLVNSSRGVLAHGPNTDSLREAAEASREDLLTVLNAA
ncbi:orotidine-5'-phosphate decarboxylase [Rothia sp. ZJ932]|uniref:orotidine-5'-phosphate decarboxylase n=1 Tax=Rothia sp. ZJ932 TaxID=2810516 RepID=UPI00196792AD|nr:orotidine-5'-phosphate decarboxylase [Rothia sp. ZJ932]QRZ62480.1 orotidine-5'-phosphate decarboxylase [Rothia sp. ZJ932]